MHPRELEEASGCETYDHKYTVSSLFVRYQKQESMMKIYTWL